MFLCKDCVVPFGERSNKKLIITLPKQENDFVAVFAVSSDMKLHMEDSCQTVEGLDNFMKLN